MLIGQVAVVQAGFVRAGCPICARRPQKLRARPIFRTWLLAAEESDLVCASACLVTGYCVGEWRVATVNRTGSWRRYCAIRQEITNDIGGYVFQCFLELRACTEIWVRRG
jgi:hypothetical protein